MPKNVETVTEEQADAALQQLVSGSETVAPEEEPTEPSVEEAKPAEPEAAPAEGAEEAEVDDLASLKKRNEELEAASNAAEERFKARLQAQQQRFATNEQILRDRYLRKSTTADKALKTLKASRSEAGVAEDEVDRVIREIEGTMHPDSASYVAPETGTTAAATEDQALILNSFLNEQGMTVEEADGFGKWIRSEATTAMSPAEQAVAGQSLDGFLRLAHRRWQEGMREKEKESKRSDAVGAVKSVQRTQREAAKAASVSATAPKKQPARPKTEVDTSKLTNEDISTLLRQSVEQYR